MWLAIFIFGIFLSPFILLLMVWIVGTTVSFMKDTISHAISGMIGRLREERCKRRQLREQRRLERLSDDERTCLAMRGDMPALELITNRDELELIIKKAENEITSKGMRQARA
jgi:hypothetical protein